MKITILEPSGYCSGVQYAMDLAIKTKLNNPKKGVAILGMLVHNQDSLKTLEKYKIATIYKKNSSLEELVNEIKEPSIVILTAHGHKKAIEDLLINNGHEVVDATCPFVKNSFEQIKKSIKENKTIFYIGVDKHPEAVAALSISNEVKFIDFKNPIIPSNIRNEIDVISQTTLSKYEIESICVSIKSVYPKANILNGICNASTSRQQAIMNISDEIDAILVVGSSTSNNSKTLFNLAKENYKNKVVKLIENESEVSKKDLLGLSNIAIISGASTPREVINKVKNKLLD